MKSPLSQPAPVSVAGLPLVGMQANAIDCAWQSVAESRKLSVMAGRKLAATAFFHLVTGLRMA
jgi:hypothetical protein